MSKTNVYYDFFPEHVLYANPITSCKKSNNVAIDLELLQRKFTTADSFSEYAAVFRYL